MRLGSVSLSACMLFFVRDLFIPVHLGPAPLAPATSKLLAELGSRFLAPNRGVYRASEKLRLYNLAMHYERDTADALYFLEGGKEVVQQLQRVIKQRFFMV